MNIVNWRKFNESVAEEDFDKKMATEIIFYFEEESEPTGVLVDEFYGIFLNDEFVFYDNSYEELKSYIEKILNICNKDSDIKIKMIQLYKKIREEREDFPTFWEIEECTDKFLDMYGFSLLVKSNTVKYEIKIAFQERISLDEFFEWCKYCETVIRKLRGPAYNSKIEMCRYGNGQHPYNQFLITLTK